MESKRRTGLLEVPNWHLKAGARRAQTVLNSDRAIAMSIVVVSAFVRMREWIASNKDLAARIDDIDRLAHEVPLEAPHWFPDPAPTTIARSLPSRQGFALDDEPGRGLRVTYLLSAWAGSRKLLQRPLERGSDLYGYSLTQRLPSESTMAPPSIWPVLRSVFLPECMSRTSVLPLTT